MEWNDISPSGKKKLVRWLRKQNRMHRSVCMSRIITTAQNERKLMKMIRFIDKCYAIKALRASQEAQEVSAQGTGQEISSDGFCEGLSPETFRTIYMEGDE